MSSYQLCPPPDLSTKEQSYVTWDNGFSESQIASIIEVGESLAFNDATIDVDQINSSIRKAKTGWIPYSPDTQFIYDGLGYIVRQLNGQFFDFDLYGFVEDFQYTVYNSDGDHYGWHMDRGSPVAPRKLSITVQLSDSDEYEGGDLQFMLSANQIITAERKKGIVYAFPSFILHRVTPVTKGTRKSLVVWVAGNKFR